MLMKEVDSGVRWGWMICVQVLKGLEGLDWEVGEQILREREHGEPILTIAVMLLEKRERWMGWMLRNQNEEKQLMRRMELTCVMDGV